MSQLALTGLPAKERRRLERRARPKEGIVQRQLFSALSIQSSWIRVLELKGGQSEFAKAARATVFKAHLRWIQRGAELGEARAIIWRQNTGGAYFDKPGSKKKDYVPFSPNGLMDLVGVGPGGVFIGIEVKRQGEKRNADQEGMGGMLEALGAIVLVCDGAPLATVAELARALQARTELSVKLLTPDGWAP